jgi:CCR4-NOT transcription complex subunit 3
MLKQSMLYCPLGPEADKPPYAPRNAYPTHPSFPTQPPSIIDSPALFEKLPMDTLFLAFYHQQGLHQQVLAAKQLKKQSWRFHKKYMTWFQRHEEPKRTEHNFEEGTYVYFDYESGNIMMMMMITIVQYLTHYFV